MTGNNTIGILSFRADVTYVDPRATTVANYFRAFFFTAGYQTSDLIAMLGSDDRAHVGLHFNIGRADAD